MVLVYESNKYYATRVDRVYARIIAPNTLRIFEVAENNYTIREYDIEAVSLINSKEFDDFQLHRLNDNQLEIITRLVTIDTFLDNDLPN